MKLSYLAWCAFLLCSCSGYYNSNAKIDSVIVYSTGWGSNYLVAQSQWMTINNPNAVISSSKKDSLLLCFQQSIQKIINKEIIKDNYFDCRIACLIFSNHSIDTLSFSRSMVMKYNTRIYEEDTVLLWAIAKMLPLYQYQEMQIERGIINDN